MLVVKGRLIFVVFTENGSKNWSESYRDHEEAKVKRFANEQLGERCAVFLLKTLLNPLASESAKWRS